tara:strand:+ start:5867 stop:6274 length:408 start_codon:yes stop_codon:yes gene_type:complete
MKNMKIIKFISKNNLKGGIYILKCYNNEKFRYRFGYIDDNPYNHFLQLLSIFNKIEILSLGCIKNKKNYKIEYDKLEYNSYINENDVKSLKEKIKNISKTNNRLYFDDKNKIIFKIEDNKNNVKIKRKKKIKLKF